MKRLHLVSVFAALLLPVACDSVGPSATSPDESDTAPDASEIMSDASRDDGGLEETDLGDWSDEWPESLHELPVVELPQTVSTVEVAAGCDEHELFEISVGVGASRFAVSAEDESIWTWSPNHYVDGVIRNGPTSVRTVGSLSERLGPPRLFLLPDDEDGARRLLHRHEYLRKDGDASSDYDATLFSPATTREERRSSWVLAVTPAERAILYETDSLDIWSCPTTSCEQPEFMNSVYTDCPLVDNCERLTSFPEPENSRAVPTFLDQSGDLYWLGEQGVWKTALRENGASELVLQTPVRSFTTNGDWIAWVELDGDAFLTHRNARTRFKLAANLTPPLFDSETASTTVWTDAEIDVFKIKGDWIWWWDGAAMRGFDLERKVNLDAAWTTELPSRPLGFELGSCSSYTLFADRVLVRTLL